MKRPSKLSESLHRQLNSYALAASAAGVGILALAQPSEAKIIYTRAHQQIAPKMYYGLDLNHDGITDFTISNFFRTVSRYRTGALWLGIPKGNFVRGYIRSCGTNSTCSWVSALPAGVKIGKGKKYVRQSCQKSSCLASMAISQYNTFGTYIRGQWLHATNRYLGLKFLINGRTHYGWARLTTSCADYQCQALLTGYAYETIPNKPIIAGKTKGKDVITVEPATLGHLARGASAISTWRTSGGGN